MCSTNGGVVFCFDDGETDRADISGNHPLNIGVSLTALAIGLEVFKTVRTLVLFEYLGPIVLCVTAVMKDIVRVVAVYAIIFASFTICGWSMVLPFQDAYIDNQQAEQQNSSFPTNYTFVDDSSMKTWKTLTNAYFWKIVFSDDEGGARIKKWEDDDVNFSLQFSHFMINANWGLYQITMAILMLNILIAIMNTTYATMWEKIDTEWKFSKTCYKAQFLTPGSAFPPPFHLIYLLALNVFHCKRRSCRRGGDPKREGVTQTLKKK